MVKSRSSREWDKRNLKSLTVTVPRSLAEEVDLAAAEEGVSRTKFIKLAIKKKLEERIDEM